MERKRRFYIAAWVTVLVILGLVVVLSAGVFSRNDEFLYIAVIAYAFNSFSLATSPIYKNFSIAAVTGSATSECITEESEWYFQV